MKSKFILLASSMLLSAASFGQASVSTNGQKYALITEGTGAWCPYCSDGIAVMDGLVSSNPKMIAVATHNSSSGRRDAMKIADGETWNSNFCVGPNLGFPYGTVDCHFFSGAGDTTVGINRNYWGTAVSAQLGTTSQYDLTMTQTYDQTSRIVTVNLTGKALTALTGNYNFNVWLTEDSVKGSGSGWDQANAYNTQSGHMFYNAGNPIPSFNHEHVLRAMFGGAWGTAAASSPAANSTVTKTFTFTIPATFSNSDGSSTPNFNHMHLVGLVQKAATGSPYNNKNMDVMNSVQAKFIPWNTTNVPNVSNFSELQIFPNPASDVITVRAQLNTPAVTTITVKNAIGQSVYSRSYAAGGSLFGETISVADFSNGIYFVNVTSNGNTTSQKVIVNK